MIIKMDKKINKKPKSYKELLNIPDTLKNKLPTSYDVIGNILLLKLDPELTCFKSEIGNTLLKVNKNIKTVCLTKPIKGELRTRDMEIISGEKSTETIHKEFGLRFKVDVKKTYFSPRLANERKRVAELVKDGEIVLDMFAGVAPFSIMIAKYAKPKIVYAFDKNKDAVRYANDNVKINNVLDKVEVIHTDAKKSEEILNQKGVKANRIIMNLPFSSYLFFENALKLVADSCTIHYYDILKEDDIDERINDLKKLANKSKINLAKFDIRKIKTYAPREFYIGVDITAKKN
jgi:tRNA (guanine37-N1)-methyltransferase